MRDAVEQTFACVQCFDDPGGWIVLNCRRHECGRGRPHYAHTFAVRCPCWLRRNADAIRSKAEQLMQKNQEPSQTFRDLSDLMSNRYQFANARSIVKDAPVVTVKQAS